MRQSTELLSLPRYVLELDRDEMTVGSIDAVVAHLRDRIEAHHCARFLAVFDHYAHTRALPDGEIAEGIRAARNVVFCFGMSIPEPEALATRPRSIGVCELEDRFVLTFLEPPMPLVNAAMESWVTSLMKDGSPVTARPDRAAGADASIAAEL